MKNFTRRQFVAAFGVAGTTIAIGCGSSNDTPPAPEAGAKANDNDEGNAKKDSDDLLVYRLSASRRASKALKKHAANTRYATRELAAKEANRINSDRRQRGRVSVVRTHARRDMFGWLQERGRGDLRTYHRARRAAARRVAARG